MSNPLKKICFFNSYPGWGGGVTFYKTHTAGMKEMGYDVIAISSPDSPLSKFYDEQGIKQWNLKISRRSFANPITIARLVSILKQESIDAIIMTTSEDLKLGAIAAKLAGIPKVIYRRGLAVPIKNKITNRYILKNIVTHIIANSEETKRTVLQNLSKVLAPESVHVIYNGLESAKLSKLKPAIWEKKGAKENHVVIGNAGRMTVQKGQLQLIPLAKALKAKGHSFTIILAGDGYLRQQIQSEIQANDLSDEIILLGYVEEIERFMSSIDIFVLTSHWEGFGYVLVEAMLQKKPVVGFEVSNIPEIIQDNKNGLLVAHRDIEAMADRIEELMMNPEKRKKFGENGYNFAIENFELAGQIKKFVKFISE